MGAVTAAAADLRAFVREQLAIFGHDRPVADDELLLTSGLMDSLAVVHLVMFMERAHGIDFAELPFDIEDFDTIARMEALIARHSR